MTRSRSKWTRRAGNTSFASLDVLSSMRTPPGVAPLLALEPANAALAAAKILGLIEPEQSDRVAANQRDRAQRVLDADSAPHA